jgi:hypothetical protein
VIYTFVILIVHLLGVIKQTEVGVLTAIYIYSFGANVWALSLQLGKG